MNWHLIGLIFLGAIALAWIGAMVWAWFEAMNAPEGEETKDGGFHRL